MSDTKQPFYKSKAFWTLISSIIAALSAFFLASCSAQAKVFRSGIHIDTVRVDYIIRSNNYTLP
nr:MAG TPA: lipoprotein [Microviridae sp.]